MTGTGADGTDTAGRGDPADAADVARRVAEVLRAVIDEVITAEVPAGHAHDIIGQLSALHRSLADLPRRTPTWSVPAAGARRTGLGDWMPVGGIANPVAPPLRCAVGADEVVGEVTYGIAHEGPPGCVHGGMIAAAFDEVLGLSQSLSGRFGMTGTLQVRYLRPTPLYRQLRLVGRLDGVEGRKLLTSGHMEVDGVITAEATGTFVALDERFAEAAAAAPGRATAAGSGMPEPAVRPQRHEAAAIGGADH